MDRTIIKHGFILILVALVAAFFIPTMKIPRLGLAAHTIGVLGGILLISVGAVWRHFLLSLNQKKTMYWSWLYANYANWLGCLIGAVFGTGRATPLASDGLTGSWFAEAAVTFILVSVGLVSLIAATLSVWGLWGEDSNASQEMKESRPR